jgi:bifunctional lysine-specific demethylase and histidyl-hydroxylase NO66
MTTYPDTPPTIGDDAAHPAAAAGWPWLRRCVADPEDFLGSYWATRPCLEPGPESRFADLLTLGELDRLLAMGAIRNVRGRPLRVRMLKKGTPMPPDAFAKASAAEADPSLAIDCERVARLLRMGGTLVVWAVDEVAPGLFDLCGGLEHELAHHVHANVYLAPPQTQGHTAHYDPHDVIILQVSGRKHWQVYGRAPDVSGRPELAAIGPAARPSIDTVLTSGDALYIPRGWVHVADTADDISLHVTVGITPALVRDLLAHALQNPEVRTRLDRPLPPGFPASAGPLASALADASQLLASALSEPDTARAVSADFARRWQQLERRSPAGLVAGAIDSMRQE